jgi:hypothetical protein
MSFLMRVKLSSLKIPQSVWLCHAFLDEAIFSLFDAPYLGENEQNLPDFEKIRVLPLKIGENSGYLH